MRVGAVGWAKLSTLSTIELIAHLFPSRAGGSVDWAKTAAWLLCLQWIRHAVDSATSLLADAIYVLVFAMLLGALHAWSQYDTVARVVF